MSLKNILIPYDSSAFADKAFEKALEIASKLNSKLHVLTVIGPNVNTAGMSWSRAQESLDEYEKEARSALEKLKEAGKKKKVTIHTDIIHDPSSTSGIIRFAESKEIDLIVIGSHGRTGLKKAVLGSVASGVIDGANCPVMIVKVSKTESKKK